MTIFRVGVGIGVGLVAGVTVTWTALVNILVQEIAGISKANINTTKRLLNNTVLIYPPSRPFLPGDILAPNVCQHKNP
jgi:hypothetical protein